MSCSGRGESLAVGAIPMAGQQIQPLQLAPILSAVTAKLKLGTAGQGLGAAPVTAAELIDCATGSSHTGLVLFEQGSLSLEKGLGLLQLALAIGEGFACHAPRCRAQAASNRSSPRSAS